MHKSVFNGLVHFGFACFYLNKSGVCVIMLLRPRSAVRNHKTKKKGETMKIKSFTTTSPIFPSVAFVPDRPVCFFVGASVFLNLMRSLLDGEQECTRSCEPDEGAARAFESRVTFELDGRECCLRGVLREDGSFTATAENKSGSSDDGATECVSRLRALHSDAANCYLPDHEYLKNIRCLSESDYRIEDFREFLTVVKRETERGDHRPIYIFNLFDRLDLSLDTTPLLDELASLGRQVFASVGRSYPESKMCHDKVSAVFVNI